MSLSRSSPPPSRLRLVSPATGEQQDLAAARDALERWELDEAVERFRALLAASEMPEALEGLGTALVHSVDAREAVRARERAFALYRERGDRRDAARVGLALAVACTALGEDELAFGWIERARALLDGLEPGAEHAWLAFWDGHLCYLHRSDLTTTRARVSEGLELARRLGLHDAELFGIALEGLTLLAQGRIDEGLRGLRQAVTATLSGEITDIDAGGQACCYLLTAWEHVQAYDQAAQWTEQIRDRSEFRRVPTSRSHCRGHWAAVLIWRGQWTEAERELVEMERELERAAPAIFQECAARLGELRRRQGRFDEAEAFYGRAGGHRLALTGRAAIALERGSPERALDLVERMFRRLREEDRLVRVPGWLVQARAADTLGLDEVADSAVASLRSLAAVAASPGLEATARFAEGFARRRADPPAACAAFEDAADLFASAGAPWEAACARVEAARLALALGRCETARSEAAAALAVLRELGAEADAARAAQLLEAACEPGPDEAPSPPETVAPPLSTRQREVLVLVAEGLSNREIGQRLFVSELTVKRHVADILTRLEVPTRAAAAALAMQRGWL